MSALRWTAAARFFGQLISWAITIWVIRLLSPGDYGLMAMAMVLVSFFVLLNTLGLDAVLVQTKELTDTLRRQVFGVVILLNCAFFLLLFFGASSVSAFYAEPALTPILQVLSIQFLLLIFETLPQSQLEREIRFTQRSIVEFTTLVIGSITTLGLALLDFGVWALVWGTVVTNATRMLGINLISPCLVWPTFNFSGMRAHLAFGSFVTTDRGLWYAFSESDKFIGGKLLGNQALGYYTVANQLASLPIQKITGMLNSIAFPAFSEVHAQTSPAKVREYLYTATRFMSMAAFPVFFGISATAESIVGCLLGEKWLPAAPLLVLLGLVMPLRLLSNVFPPLLWGVGQPRSSAINFLLASIFMPLAFFLGARYDVLGLAYAWLGMYPLVFTLTAWRTCRAVSAKLLRYFAQLLKPLAAASIMYAVVYAVRELQGGDPQDWWFFCQLIGAGVASFLAGIWLLDREGLMEVAALLRA